MKTVWKFQIPVRDEFALGLPSGAEVIHVDTQRGTPQVWVLLDPNDDRLVQRTFRLAGTGHPIDPAGLGQHLGTFLLNDGDLVFHLFERIDLDAAEAALDAAEGVERPATEPAAA